MLTSNFKKFFLSNVLALAFTMLILIFYFPVGGAIDMHLIQPFIDASGSFPYRDNWYLVHINHKIFKNILIAVYLAFLILWLASFKIQRLKTKRWLYGYMFFVCILSTSVIGILKSQSAHACPWEMTQPTTLGYIWNFSATNGHCFPGGHASTGFALLTGFFVYRLVQPKLAYAFLGLGLVIGFILGWGQMMRGAHFLSHNLWTGWIIFAFNLLLYCCFYKKFKENAQNLESNVPSA
ncbi:phosphatase PAP2 family protein [Acinetobacter silvestris]|uniref:Phosphatidic acid phosphatase type 2/haloperoxidase domain-containing protein n=1 Tax=Acinetobacter silvestris TaxID=1977882 RepID=A0A1Y3CJJ6_9GAMM|nr:phosphatase PAP2 family protein [Acinetobacter silvestris]OTG66768.1 hypothetical protein B9T28_05945 [Acinetobacter silvestris]